MESYQAQDETQNQATEPLESESEEEGSLLHHLMSSPDMQALIKKADTGAVVTDKNVDRIVSQSSLAVSLDEVLDALSEMGVEVTEMDAIEDDSAFDAEGGNKPSRSRSASLEDPLHLYFQEMGAFDLLSREQEIEVAKRIAQGREMMLQALYESQLTIRAIAAWREELDQKKIFLKNLIDIEAARPKPSTEEEEEEFLNSEDTEPSENFEGDDEAENENEEEILPYRTLSDSLRSVTLETLSKIEETYHQYIQAQHQRRSDSQKEAAPPSQLEQSHKDQLILIIKNKHTNR